MRVAVGAAIIENKKILLVRKKESWILPGGKPEEEETETQCLIREVKEELSTVRIVDIHFYKAIEGITPHKGDLLQARVYLTTIEGEAKPSAEINAVKWTEKPEELNLSDITRKIVASLRQDGYL